MFCVLFEVHPRPGAWDAYYADDEDAIWDAIARTTFPTPGSQATRRTA